MSTKQDYDFYKSIGICPRCKKRPAEPHGVLCMECAGRDSDRYHEKGRCETTLQKDRRRKKMHYEQCKKDCICPKCGKDVKGTGYVYCKRCRAQMGKWRKKHRKGVERSERVAYGICYLCGKNPILPGKGVCAECYETRLIAINKCNEKRQEGFNDYWKRDNKLIFGGAK